MSAIRRFARAAGPARLAVLAAGVIALAIVIVRSAWVCDDSFITLRTVDNLVNGFGPRWNVAERVQTFTHPLWMLLLAGFYLFTREAYYTVLGISILIAAVAAGWLVARVARSTPGALLAVAVLILSKAHVDYSTSGLENPLTHLLLVLFASFYLPAEGRKERPLALALIAGLLVLNRMDLLLLVAPALAVALRALPWKRGVGVALVGFSPFLAWEAFALVYYGAPFPNSAYAKLATGIPRIDLIRQGGQYVIDSITVDPVTLTAIAAAAVLAVWKGHRRERILMAGAGLYLVYVLWIGGDFMSGRFFSAPLVVAAIVLSRWRPGRPRALVYVTAAAFVAVGLIIPVSPVRSGADYAEKRRGRAIGRARITDERAFYYAQTGLLRARPGAPMPDHDSAREGREARAAGPQVVVRGGVGFFGYHAGPDVHIVEPWAVTDPLLARLPVPLDEPWRIGHFTRTIPPGYVDSLRTGTNRIADPRIARLYSALVIVTRGPLVTAERLIEIWRLNTGVYRPR